MRRKRQDVGSQGLGFIAGMGLGILIDTGVNNLMLDTAASRLSDTRRP